VWDEGGGAGGTGWGLMCKGGKYSKSENDKKTQTNRNQIINNHALNQILQKSGQIMGRGRYCLAI